MQLRVGPWVPPPNWDEEARDVKGETRPMIEEPDREQG